MSPRADDSEGRFAAIVKQLARNPDVTPRATDANSNKRFGSSGLKIRNRIFAMVARGRLVVKLPQQRVDALVAKGEGERFDPRRDGRLMNEWFVLRASSEMSWLSLAKEAMDFVAKKS